jgi:hypothetical protein
VLRVAVPRFPGNPGRPGDRASPSDPLAGQHGDAISVILAAANHNLRLILAWLRHHSDAARAASLALK